MSEKDWRVFGGTMLIAGTTIGAAMLAMPILTGLFGFFGTVAIMVACWLFMYWTATLILEAILQFRDDASFVTMARDALGKSGALVTWFVFLMLFYSLVAAYLSGSGRIIIDGLEAWFSIEIPMYMDILPLLVLFAPCIYFGLSMVDHLNRYLMVGMLMTYGAMAIYMVPHIETENLLYNNWKYSLLSFSVVIASFGYQVIIPTLVTYLDRDHRRIRRCMFFGSFIPLIVYFIWELCILGTIPAQGAHGLTQAYLHDISLAKLLSIQVDNDFIIALAGGFSIFAIVTSFLGVAQGLFDFLKDGLRSNGISNSRPLAFTLTFLPPILFLVFFERGFIVLLEYAGALVSIILGIIPILIVYRLRKRKGQIVEYRAPGNNFMLMLGVLFFIFVVLLVVLKNLGFINFFVG